MLIIVRTAIFGSYNGRSGSMDVILNYILNNKNKFKEITSKTTQNYNKKWRETLDSNPDNFETISNFLELRQLELKYCTNDAAMLICHRHVHVLRMLLSERSSKAVDF